MSNYYQVKIIGNRNSAEWLETDINVFFGQKEIELIDIKYQNWNENHPDSIPGHEVFSAMIIYKEVFRV